MKKALVFRSCEIIFSIEDICSDLEKSREFADLEKSREFRETSLREFLKNRLKADDVTGRACLWVLEDMVACD